MQLKRIAIEINRYFTWATGVVLLVVGAIFLYQAIFMNAETFIRVGLSLIGVFFVGGGLYYYIKSKRTLVVD